MNNFESLNYFYEYRYNDYYKPTDSPARQLTVRMDYGALEIYLIAVIDTATDKEESCKEIYNVIWPIFSELEWKIVNDISEFKVKLTNLIDKAFHQIVEKYPYEFKYISLVGPNKYKEERLQL